MISFGFPTVPPASNLLPKSLFGVTDLSTHSIQNCVHIQKKKNIFVKSFIPRSKESKSKNFCNRTPTTSK